MAYPNTEGAGYSFEKGEIKIDGAVFKGIGKLGLSQPTTRAAIHGTSSVPLEDTPGKMDLGAGSAMFTDLAERERLLNKLQQRADALEVGYREVPFTVIGHWKALGKPPIEKVAYGCKMLDEPDEHESGDGGGLSSECTFSYLYHTINGKRPHTT